MQLLIIHPEGQRASSPLPLRARLASGATAFLALCLAGISTSAPAAAQSPLDVTIKVTPRSAPDGGVFHVTGTTSCTQTDVTLTFTNYDGDFDHQLQHARIVSQDRNGTMYYALDYVVPARAAPGRASLFADTRCGDPNAAASPPVEVTITKAPMRLAVTGSRTLTITGTRCYGDPDNVVTIHASGAVTTTRRATLTGDRFIATFSGPPGPVTFRVGAPDCRGSNPATVSGRFAGAPSPASSRTASPSPNIPTTGPSPSSSPSRSRSSVSASPSGVTPTPAPATYSADPGPTSGSELPLLWLGLAAVTVAAGGSFGLWRRRRA